MRVNDDRCVGWLGAGRMGRAMAERLVGAGYSVTVWNRTASKSKELVRMGADPAETIGELGRGDVVFTSVTSSPDLLDVTLGPEGLLHAQPAPRIVVDTSTASADAGTRVRAEAARAGL